MPVYMYIPTDSIYIYVISPGFNYDFFSSTSAHCKLVACNLAKTQWERHLLKNNTEKLLQRRDYKILTDVALTFKSYFHSKKNTFSK